jgi:hypothetical protein
MEVACWAYITKVQSLVCVWGFPYMYVRTEYGVSVDRVFVAGCCAVIDEISRVA